jgi:hypothetical protein
MDSDTKNINVIPESKYSVIKVIKGVEKNTVHYLGTAVLLSGAPEGQHLCFATSGVRYKDGRKIKNTKMCNEYILTV